MAPFQNLLNDSVETIDVSQSLCVAAQERRSTARDLGNGSGQVEIQTSTVRQHLQVGHFSSTTIVMAEFAPRLLGFESARQPADTVSSSDSEAFSTHMASPL